MPATEFHVTLDRRELASVLAGLRLLRWSNGPDARLIPVSVRREIEDIELSASMESPLSDAEIGELARRLG